MIGYNTRGPSIGGRPAGTTYNYTLTDPHVLDLALHRPRLPGASSNADAVFSGTRADVRRMARRAEKLWHRGARSSTGAGFVGGEVDLHSSFLAL